MSFNAKESLRFYKRYSYDELVTTLSDYHKDVIGSRLRMNGEPLKEILRQLLLLDKYVADPRNRTELESEGWIFKEPKSFDEKSEKFALDDHLVNLTAGVDPHFWGPGYDEE